MISLRRSSSTALHGSRLGWTHVGGSASSLESLDADSAAVLAGYDQGPPFLDGLTTLSLAMLGLPLPADPGGRLHEQHATAIVGCGDPGAGEVFQPAGGLDSGPRNHIAPAKRFRMSPHAEWFSVFVREKWPVRANAKIFCRMPSGSAKDCWKPCEPA